MKDKSLYCDRCARGCEVTLTQDGGCYFISGNNCPGGEQTARETWTFLKDYELLNKKKNEKIGFLSKLFSRKKSNN